MSHFILSRAVLTALAFSFCSICASAEPVTSQVTPGATVAAGAPTKAIGPAPANSKQSKVLGSALSPKTRETLQAAMDSMAN